MGGPRADSLITENADVKMMHKILIMVIDIFSF